MLQVAVHHDAPVAGGRRQADKNCAGQSANGVITAYEANRNLCFGSNLPDDSRRVIVRVIDENDFRHPST